VLFLGEVEKILDDAGSVLVKMSLQIRNRTIPVVPNLLVVMRGARDRFVSQNLGMHAGDQHFLVI
jgi:hypothetical protein